MAPRLSWKGSLLIFAAGITCVIVASIVYQPLLQLVGPGGPDDGEVQYPDFAFNITVSVSFPNGTVDSKHNLTFPGNETVFYATNQEFELEYDTYPNVQGYFVKTINGVTPDQGWLFFVDDEYVPRASNLERLRDDMVISWVVA